LLAKVLSSAVVGIDAYRVEVEVDITSGLPTFTIVGFPEASVKETSRPEYENYSLFILVRHILMHNHWHMYRMEELWLTRDAYLTKLE